MKISVVEIESPAMASDRHSSPESVCAAAYNVCSYRVAEIDYIDNILCL